MITVEELDQYRRDYRNGHLTRQDHIDLYTRVAADYPDQRYYDRGHIWNFMRVVRPFTVVELGGWNGQLAADIMAYARPPITRWTNYELAPIDPVPDTQLYTKIDDHWLWDKNHHAGAFVASHSLEHLTDTDLELLLSSLDNVRFAYVDVPLLDVPYDWNGSTTTHVLTMSIQQFDDAWADHGWHIFRREHLRGTIPSNVRFLVKA